MSERCQRCDCPIESSDLRCSVCGLATPAGAAPPARALATVLRCEGCGAALAYEVEARAPRCAFCGSVAHLEQPEDPIEQADAFLPFFVESAAAQQALRAWMSSLGFFRPSDLVSQASVESLQPLWWVAWVFDAKALVSWTADSDYGSRRSAWAPHAGQAELDMNHVLVSASRGLSASECGRLTPYFDLASAQSQAQRPTGTIVERFDVQRSQARQIVARAVEGHAAASAGRWIPGSRHRNLHVAVLVRSLTTRRLALPSFVLAYRYRGELYRAVVHGQNPRIVFGNAPYSWLKIVAVAAFVLGAVAVAVVLVIVLS